MTVDNSAVETADTTDDVQTTAAPTGAVAASEAPQGTILGGAPVEDKPVAVQATWPDDWRAKVAGEDAKELARLQRMNSPADLWKSYRALEQKLQEKSTRFGPPDNATPEQMAAWKKEAGLPDSVDGYTPELPNGMVLGEADKPLVEGFKEIAHKAHMTPAQFNEALGWYYREVDAFQTKQQDADREFRTQSEDNLRAEFGPEYRANLNGVNNMLTMYFGDTAAEILSARGPDNRMLGDKPEFIKSMALLTRELNPAMPHIPAGSNPVQATSNRIAEIEKTMRSDPARYWKDEGMQSEYRDLLDAKDRLAGKAA